MCVCNLRESALALSVVSFWHLFLLAFEEKKRAKCVFISEVTNLAEELGACTDNIKTWMTEHQLKLIDDKTAALLFSFPFRLP